MLLSQTEILSPEKCILCHKPRRDPKAREGEALPETPFCDTCFHGTAPYYREHLMWTRRNVLAREALLESNGLESAITQAIDLLREMSKPMVFPTFPLDEMNDQLIKQRLSEMTAVEQLAMAQWLSENRKPIDTDGSLAAAH